jgi:hypothetical protein
MARFCVLGSDLVRGHEPTIARFRAEVSGGELAKSGVGGQEPVRVQVSLRLRGLLGDSPVLVC